ncbi:MAG: hypothetical protein M1824_001462 [Vezdaea acicularis]|nr:MAG: hypothetical protein M1824_001462 [Vezdaea acicularis]
MISSLANPIENEQKEVITKLPFSVDSTSARVFIEKDAKKEFNDSTNTSASSTAPMPSQHDNHTPSAIPKFKLKIRPEQTRSAPAAPELWP